MENIREWAADRETSIEIAEAIFNYRKTEKARQRVWENPTEREMALIEKKAWASTDEDELFWGSQTTLERK
jgi:hypothetical protein